MSVRVTLLLLLLSFSLTGCVAASAQPAATCSSDRDCAALDCPPSGCECIELDCVPRCGNGVVDALEACDPDEDPDECLQDCTLLPGVCGDGVVFRDEDCEPPDTATCSPDCLAVACHDGRLDPGEDCEAAGDEPACGEACFCPASTLCAGYDYAVAVRADGAMFWFGRFDPGLGEAPTPLGPGRPSTLSIRAEGATRLSCTFAGARLLSLDAAGVARLFEPEGARLGPDGIDRLGGVLPAPAGETWAELSAGDTWFALRTDAGRAFVLGDGAPGGAPPRTLAELPGRWTALSAGGFHLLLLAEDGSLHALGSNPDGALGTLGATVLDTPTKVPGLHGCDRISATRSTSFARCDELDGCNPEEDARADELGIVPLCEAGWHAFGHDGSGSAGVGDRVASAYEAACVSLGLWTSCVPRPHPMLATLVGLQRFTGTEATVLALGEQGDLYGLGNNFRGSNGEHGNAHGIPDVNGADENEWNQDRPKAVPSLDGPVREVAVSGRWASLLLYEDGRLAATGEGCALSLGLGTLPIDVEQPIDACHPTATSCYADADLFRAVSLCARDPVRYDTAGLACGRP